MPAQDLLFFQRVLAGCDQGQDSDMEQNQNLLKPVLKDDTDTTCSPQTCKADRDSAVKDDTDTTCSPPTCETERELSYDEFLKADSEEDEGEQIEARIPDVIESEAFYEQLLDLETSVRRMKEEQFEISDLAVELTTENLNLVDLCEAEPDAIPYLAMTPDAQFDSECSFIFAESQNSIQNLDEILELIQECHDLRAEISAGLAATAA